MNFELYMRYLTLLNKVAFLGVFCFNDLKESTDLTWTNLY